MVMVFLIILACDSLENPFLEELPSDGVLNQAPQTHLFLEFAPDQIDTVISDTSADTTIIYVRHLPDTTTSQQHRNVHGKFDRNLPLADSK